MDRTPVSLSAELTLSLPKHSCWHTFGVPESGNGAERLPKAEKCHSAPLRGVKKELGEGQNVHWFKLLYGNVLTVLPSFDNIANEITVIT